ncbi:MAG: AI-2E family transporter [Planctomycetes bacterium]|nr:AI-2E family transporter [Planctomycetota bacterium]
MSAEVEKTSRLPQPWERIFGLGSRLFVWGLLFSILYILRPFFLLVFLTFVFAYILEHGVQGLEHRIRRRAVRVILVSAVFLGTLITIGVFLAPHFKDQASKLGDNYPTYLSKIDDQLDVWRENETFRNLVPPSIKARDYLNDLLGLVSEEDESEASPANQKPEEPDLLEELADFPGGVGELVSTAEITWAEFLAFANGRGESAPGDVIEKLATAIRDAEYESSSGTRIDARWLTDQWTLMKSLRTDPKLPKANIAKTIETMQSIAGPILNIGSAFLLSLLFSFLIVLDLPKLRRAVQGLADTKLRFIYEEVAGNIHDFGKMLGRALEAQLFIAITNTALTAFGLYLLGLTANMVFFSSIVFFCSFIPVAGVFLSSIPIALEALSTPDGGVELMLIAIAMILVVHFVEAYFLNPKIFGHHLHMNAVLVLIVLTIGGKLFGVWGLILGLPVVNYFFGHAIRRHGGANREIGKAA